MNVKNPFEVWNQNLREQFRWATLHLRLTLPEIQKLCDGLFVSLHVEEINELDRARNKNTQELRRPE